MSNSYQLIPKKPFKTVSKELVKQSFKRILPKKLTGKYDNPIGGFLFTVLHRYYKTDGCRFKFPYELVPVESRSRFMFDLYEQAERVLVKELIRPEERVIELGACIGVVACVTNKLLTSQSKHVVVEANPYLIGWIYQNSRLNGCNFLVELGMAGEGRQRMFYLSQNMIRSSAQRQTTEPTQIVVRSLEELEQKHGKFNVLIMDIEGGEIEVLRQARKLLSHYRLVIVELHDFIIGQESVEECRHILNTNGFMLKKRLGYVEAWVNEEKF